MLEKIEKAISDIKGYGLTEGAELCVSLSLENLETIHAALTTPPQQHVDVERKNVWEPIFIEGASYILSGDFRLCVDPSVPTEMILFPDDETREWFVKRLEENDELDESCHQKTTEIIDLKKALHQRGLLGVPAWQPIETAPKDGTRIIGLISKDWAASMRWVKTPYGEGWDMPVDVNPTEWMPFKPPAEKNDV